MNKIRNLFQRIRNKKIVMYLRCVHILVVFVDAISYLTVSPVVVTPRPTVVVTTEKGGESITETPITGELKVILLSLIYLVFRASKY